MDTHRIHAGNGQVEIDSRTIRRLDANMPSIGTADRTDGREGWAYYGLSTSGDPWVWVEYNADGVGIHETSILDGDIDEDTVSAIADEIQSWDSDHAGWLRGLVEESVAIDAE